MGAAAAGLWLAAGLRSATGPWAAAGQWAAAGLWAHLLYATGIKAPEQAVPPRQTAVTCRRSDSNAQAFGLEFEVCPDSARRLGVCAPRESRCRGKASSEARRGRPPTPRVYRPRLPGAVPHTCRPFARCETRRERTRIARATSPRQGTEAASRRRALSQEGFERPAFWHHHREVPGLGCPAVGGRLT